MDMYVRRPPKLESSYTLNIHTYMHEIWLTRPHIVYICVYTKTGTTRGFKKNIKKYCAFAVSLTHTIATPYMGIVIGYPIVRYK